MLKKYILNPIESKGRRVLISLLQISLVFAIIYSISFIIYIFLYSRFLPSAVIRQSVFFDFNLDQPKALLSLPALHKQWTNLKVKQVMGSGVRTLRSGAYYDIEGIFTFAKSPRNLELGKVALTSILIDNTAEAIAKSVRPVVIPYYTDTYLFLETVCNFPSVYFFGNDLSRSGETKVHVTLMKDYQEPYYSYPPSEVLELTISDSTVDLVDMELIIVPHLNFFTYWLFHYPRLSFLIGLLIFSLGEGLFYFGCCILSILFIAMTDFEADKRIQEEMEYTTGFEGVVNEFRLNDIASSGVNSVDSMPFYIPAEDDVDDNQSPQSSPRTGSNEGEGIASRRRLNLNDDADS